MQALPYLASGTSVDVPLRLAVAAPGTLQLPHWWLAWAPTDATSPSGHTMAPLPASLGQPRPADSPQQPLLLTVSDSSRPPVRSHDWSHGSFFHTWTGEPGTSHGRVHATRALPHSV
jgi:hypothetical protein